MIGEILMEDKIEITVCVNDMVRIDELFKILNEEQSESFIVELENLIERYKVIR